MLAAPKKGFESPSSPSRAASSTDLLNSAWRRFAQRAMGSGRAEEGGPEWKVGRGQGE